MNWLFTVQARQVSSIFDEECVMEKINMRIRIGISVLVLLLCFAGGFISAYADDGDENNTLFYVEVETYGKGIVTISDRYGVILGDPVYLEAIAEPGYVFLGWFVKSGNPDVTYDTEDGREVTVVNTGEDVSMIAVFGLPYEKLLDSWLFTCNNNVKLNLSYVVSKDEASLYSEILHQAQSTRINVATKDIYRYDRFVDNISVMTASELTKGGVHDANILIWSNELDEMVSLPIIVTVIDDIAPIIESENEIVTLITMSDPPTSWIELFGLSAVDETDGTITSQMYFDLDLDNINMDIPRTYKIVANVHDEAGNYALAKELTLIIEDALGEVTDPRVPENSNGGDSQVTPNNSTMVGAPLTGDSTHIIMWSVMILLSLIVSLSIAIHLKKGKRKTI